MPSRSSYTLATTSASDEVGTANARGAWIPLNQYVEPFDASFFANVSGAPKWTVQHTFDDVFDSSVTPIAVDHSSVSGVSSPTDGSYTEPVIAVRLILASAAASGAFSSQFTVLQAGY